MPHEPRRPELLAPAGTLDMMRTAFAYGADAVYAGQPRYSLRVRNNSFGQLDTLAAGIDEAHAAGKLFYLVANIYPHNAKIRSFEDDMAPVMAMKPDALIMADPGLMMMVRERWPETDIHLSVQANTTNYASVRFWQSVGVKRIILSRELSLDEVAEIRDACPDMELEVFVHGALCIAYLGRCLLSGYFNHRDPNQGTCTNSCRWDYKLHEAGEDGAGDLQARGNMPIGNPRDAGAVGTRHPQQARHRAGPRPGRRAAPHRRQQGLAAGGGHPPRRADADRGRRARHLHPQLQGLARHRARAATGGDRRRFAEDRGPHQEPYYVARAAQGYRRAIEDAVAGRPFDPRLLGELEGLASRGYTDGFYQRHSTPEHQNYLRGHSESGRSLLVGEVVGWDAGRGLAEVEVKNGFGVGDRLEFVQPDGNRELLLDRIVDANGDTVTRIPGSGRRVWLPLPPGADPAQPCFIARFL